MGYWNGKRDVSGHFNRLVIQLQLWVTNPIKKYLSSALLWR